MKQLKRWSALISWLLITLSASTAAWAEHTAPPQDNRLSPLWEDSGNKTIDFTQIDIKFTAGRTFKGVTEDFSYTAVSTSTSVFSLNSVTDGYDNVVFNGVLVIDAKISSRGIMQAGSTFSVYSNDAVFGTDYTTDYNCNKAGNNCSSGQLVYGGDLNEFGWAESIGIFEFDIVNLTGWAKDNWSPLAETAEHILLNVDCSTQPTSGPGICFDMFSTSRVKTFEATADGFVVVPDETTVVANR